MYEWQKERAQFARPVILFHLSGESVKLCETRSFSSILRVALIVLPFVH